MIATILPSSPTFHAVYYNEKKVADGSASMLEIKNFHTIIGGSYTPDDLANYLIDYSACNSRIKQPQMHVAFSCKGHDYTPSQLMDIAHQWLDEMGYGDPDQPLLIYEHHDTDNTHIHIITSRIDPRGKKIDHNHEKRRSQVVLDKIMNTDLKKEAEQNVKTAMQFDFRSVSQFKCVLEAMKYECYDKNGMIMVKKGGVVQTSIPSDQVKKQADTNNLKRMYAPGEMAKLKAIMHKYQQTSCSRQDLERDLKAKFGISLVFFGKSDSPYGYAVVDFNKKKVYPGGHIMSITELLDFKTPEEHFKDIEELIHNELEQTPFISTHELNQKLKRMGAYVKKGTVCFGSQKRALTQMQTATLSRNDKVAWRNGFQPQSEAERDVVCKLTGFDYPDMIAIKDRSNYFTKDYNELKAIFDIQETDKKVSAFETAGFRFVSLEGREYIFRAGTQTIIDLERSGFNKGQYADLSNHYQKHSQSQSTSVGRALQGEQRSGQRPTMSQKPRMRAEGSQYANREWEVGKKGSDEDDMDRNNNLSY